jgi:hypothetical protein
MYVWKINRLNEQLMSGELSEVEKFKYLIANTIIYSLAMIQYYAPNAIDTWSGFLYGIIALVGVVIIYYCNGGSSGKHLLQRYLSISWVVLVRMLVLLMLPTMIALFAIQEIYLGGVPDETTYIDMAYTTALEVIYVLWVAKHVNKVARAAHA